MVDSTDARIMEHMLTVDSDSRPEERSRHRRLTAMTITHEETEQTLTADSPDARRMETLTANTTEARRTEQALTMDSTEERRN